jgi:hypothetical protein
MKQRTAKQLKRMEKRRLSRQRRRANSQYAFSMNWGYRFNY